MSERSGREGALRAESQSESESEAESILHDLAQVFLQSRVGDGSDWEPTQSATRLRVGAVGTEVREATGGEQDGVIAVADDGSILSVSEAAARTFGREAARMVGEPLRSFVFPERAPPGEELLGDLLRRADLVGQRENGTKFHVGTTVSELVVHGQHCFVLVVCDAGERQRADERRRRVEARYRTLVEQIPAVTFMASLDEEENELYVGPQIESLLGFTQKEWLEDPILWFRQMHPDDQESWIAEFTRGCANGGPFRADCRFFSRDGRTVWVHGEARVVRDDDGRPLFVQGVAFDISDIKEAEEKVREAHATVVRSEKLAAIGQLAAGVAHELRNPLSSVRGAWFYIEKKLKGSGLVESDGRLAELALILPAELGRCAKIIGDLLDFSRERPPHRTPAPIRELVRSALAVVVRPAATIQLLEEIQEGLPAVNVDAEQFRQVLVNLVQNAVESVSATTGWVKVRAFAEGDIQTFEVSDNGRGIPKDILSRIFDPLFTTKLRGTGLGLAIVDGIVKRHGGTISVTSQPGRGTTFVVSVPVGKSSTGPTPDRGGAADLREA